MKKRTGYIFGLLLLVAIFAQPAFAEEIAIPGTGDGVDVLTSIGKAFTLNTKVEVLVPKSIGSSNAIKVVGTDKAVLGRVARGIKDDEKEYGLEYKPLCEVPTFFTPGCDGCQSDGAAGS
jgi:phosphate transport system substrate-binding protein